MLRKTINNTIEFSGTGLHTGQSVSLRINPCEEAKGIRFVRSDLDNDLEISADISNIHSTLRGTNLKKAEVEIRTVEHILSALSANGVTDAELVLDGPEVPILDGSSSIFCKSLNEAGYKELDKEIDQYVIAEPFSFKHENGAEYHFFPSDKLEITTLIDYDNEYISKQFAILNDLKDYDNEIAPNRTFALASEVETLMKNDLIKGGSLSNALIFVDVDIDNQKWKALSQNWGLKEFSKNEQGLINGKSKFFDNEPARHKLLDLIGDLSLIGKPIVGKIIANKPGHTANIAVAKELKKKYLAQRKSKGRPIYDPNVAPVFDIEGIKSYLPHRYPFLLIDKIIEISESHVVGVKNVTMNEAFFQGHFPGNPVFPGVLQMEALAQTGGMLVLNTVDNPREYDTYFLKMDNVRFKRKVVPGDTLILKMELLGPVRRGLVNMKATAYVGEHVVSEGDLLAQIIKREA